VAATFAHRNANEKDAATVIEAVRKVVAAK
jgi:hypothetical protein